MAIPAQNYCCRRERLPIVFDGLNELPQNTPLDFFPGTLPPRVFFVVLSQPCHLLEQLQGQVQVDKVALKLGGLSEDEVLQWLDLVEAPLAENQRRELVRRAKGWPLYLKRAIDWVRAGGSWAAVPPDIEGFYQQAIRQAFTLGDEGLISHALGVLWATKEPLSINDLSAIMGENAHRVRTKALEPVRAYLLIVERQVSLWHETFRDFLERELFNPDQARQFQEEIVRWCREPRS